MIFGILVVGAHLGSQILYLGLRFLFMKSRKLS